MSYMKKNGSRIKIQAYPSRFLWYIVFGSFSCVKDYSIANPVRFCQIPLRWQNQRRWINTVSSDKASKQFQMDKSRSLCCTASLRPWIPWHLNKTWMRCDSAKNRSNTNSKVLSKQPRMLWHWHVFQDEKWMKGWSLVGPCWVCHTGQQAREALLLLCYFNLGNSMMLGCDNVMLSSNSSVHLRPLILGCLLDCSSFQRLDASKWTASLLNHHSNSDSLCKPTGFKKETLAPSSSSAYPRKRNLKSIVKLSSPTDSRGLRPTHAASLLAFQPG